MYVYRKDGRFLFLGFDSRNYSSLFAIIRDVERITGLEVDPSTRIPMPPVFRLLIGGVHDQLVPCPGWPFSSCFTGVEDNLDDSDSEDYIPFLGELAGGVKSKPSEKSSQEALIQRSPSGGVEEFELPTVAKRPVAPFRQFHLHRQQPQGESSPSSADAVRTSALLYDSPLTSPIKPSLAQAAVEVTGQKLLLRCDDLCMMHSLFVIIKRCSPSLSLLLLCCRQDSLMNLMVNDPELEEKRKQREEERKEREAQWAKEEEERKRRREERRKYLTT